MNSPMHSPVLKKILLSLAAAPLMKKLNQASQDIRGAQLQVLTSIIRNAENTAFGKEHRFPAIKTYSDFIKAVPVRDFEGHRPYIKKMCRGETDVLFPGKPLFYNTTSGTVDKPKLIPVSESYFKTAYSQINKLWFAACLKDNPLLFHGQNLSAVAPAVEGYVEDGTPFGSISGVAYRNIPAILKDLYSTPYPIICIKDYQAKYYAMMRCALGTTISYIITINPSTLLQFHRTVLENRGDLLKDIHDGTLRSDVAAQIAPADRHDVLKQFTPNPAKARQLESIFQTHEEHLLPLHYWPDLVCINTWKQGNCSLILPKLAGHFPKNTVFREFGYQASEVRAGLVLGNEWNYSLLLAHQYLFEFIEASSPPAADSPVLQPHELEIGKSYYILFSNGSGLYRYNINDIVRVTGFYRQFPLFEFIQKGEGVTSLTGEKLSEVQVIRAVEEAARAIGIPVDFYTMFCDRKIFCYRLFAEFPADTGDEIRTMFLQEFDKRLMHYNQEYAVKRRSDRLPAPVLAYLLPNSYERLKKKLIEEDLAREGQYKVRYLMDDEEMLLRYKVLTDKKVLITADI